MVVDHFDFERIAIDPIEANAKLIVHSEAPLAFAVPNEFLQSIAGRDAQIAKACRGVKQQQLTESDAR